MAAARVLGRLALGVRNPVIVAPASKRVISHVEQVCNIKRNTCKISSRFISTSSCYQSTDVHEEEEIKEPPSFISNLFGFTKPENETQLVTEEELKEREQLFEEVSDMYFAKPRQYPSIEFYEKAVDLLIKYNDDHGVRSIWFIMSEEKVQPPEELICKMEEFLDKARETSWFK